MGVPVVANEAENSEPGVRFRGKASVQRAVGVNEQGREDDLRKSAAAAEGEVAPLAPVVVCACCYHDGSGGDPGWGVAE